MVKDPSKFDLLVMPNLYGDILRYDFLHCVVVVLDKQKALVSFDE